MNIVIVGAGDIGRYLAEILVDEQFNVILVDDDMEKLEKVSQDIDVAIRYGSGTDWQILDELLELSPDLFIAVTGNDEANLVACDTAKNLGYPRTVARVKNERYLNATRLDFARVFEVDNFISPELLVAQDIFKYMSSPGSLAVESFAHGAVQMRTIVVPPRWRKAEIRLCDLNLPSGMVVALIRRQVSATSEGAGATTKKVIFPHGDDTILPGDEVTVIGESDVVADIHFLFGSARAMVKSVALMGGCPTMFHLAKILEQRDVSIKIIENDRKLCGVLADQLPRTTIINGEPSDLDLLLSEKVDTVDMAVVCCGEDERNIGVGLLVKETGCENIVLVLSDKRFVPLVDKLGISHTVSPRVSVVNRVLSLARKQTVSSMVSVYEHQAEIVELTVSPDSKVVGIRISELGPQLPKDFLIAVIQNRGRIMIANGNRILSPGDTVIVVTHPRHIQELEKVF